MLWYNKLDFRVYVYINVRTVAFQMFFFSELMFFTNLF